MSQGKTADGGYQGSRGGGIRPGLLFLAGGVAGFAGTLLILLLLRGGRGAPPPFEPPAPAIGAGSPASLPVFTDVTDALGIRFQHEAGSRGKFYYPEVMGAGCAFFDYDGDGDLDVYFVNGNLLPPEKPSPTITNALYRNDRGGAFTEVTAAAGVGDPSYGQGCCAADYDGDGDEDLYVTNFGPNVLYRNRGDGTFEKAVGAVADPGWGQSCAFLDVDGDGDLDLYLQNYLVYSLENHEDWYISVGGQQALDYCSPQNYRGQQDRLLLNLGDGTFRDVTESCGIVKPEGTGMGLACADFDNDGDMDIFVANDSRPNFYFQNDGKGKFAECALTKGLAYNGEGGTEAFMGVDVGDYDGDGLLDLAVPSLRAQGFNLYRNLGDTFAEVSVAAGVDNATRGATGFAPVFFDYDNDGDLDLFFTSGEVRMGRTEGGAEGSFTDRYAMKSLLLENRGGRFIDVSPVAGSFFRERRIGRACAAGDYDDDGDIDLLVTAMGGRAILLRNDTVGGNWVGFRLAGKPPNRDAVGARLTLKVGGRTLVREIYAGGSYLGQRDRRVVFGLGEAPGFEELKVRWPDGLVTTHRDLEMRRYHDLPHPAPSRP